MTDPGALSRNWVQANDPGAKSWTQETSSPIGAADFVMTAAVQLVDNNAGGAGGEWVGCWGVGLPSSVPSAAA